MSLHTTTGTSIKVEISHVKKILCGLVDAALAILFVSLILVYQTPGQLYQLIAPIDPSLLILIGLIIYRFTSFAIFNGTVGMKLFGVILLSGEQQPLSIIEKLLASFFVLYKGVDYYSR
jgi:hypothetical protein